MKHVFFIVFLYLLAVFCRIYSVQYFESIYKDELPFTLESAMLFYYANYYHENHHYPNYDIRVQYPEGVDVKKTFSVGYGMAASWISPFFIKKISYQKYMKIFTPAFFCLGVVGIYLLSLYLSNSMGVSVIVSVFYGTALPSLIRSTGIEFSRENFAIPWIIFNVVGVFVIFHNRKLKQTTIHWIAFLSSVCVGIGLMTWDMTQIYLYVMAPIFLYCLLSQTDNHTAKIFIFYQWGICFVVGLCNPYLNAHYWNQSLWMFLMGFALLGSCIFSSQYFMRWILLFTGVFVWYLVSRQYANTYQHFLKLFMAKIWFLGHKPVDPERLSYAVRSLWVPELQSAFESVRGIKHIQLFLPWGYFLSWPWGRLAGKIIKKKHTLWEGSIFYLVSVFAFLFLWFSRFEVFLMIFVALLVLWFCVDMMTLHSVKLLKVMGCLLVITIVSSQIYASLYHYKEWGRSADYENLIDLKKWVQNHCNEKTVILSHFGLSAFLFAYTPVNIVIHPKFESPDLRRKVKRYIDSIFSVDENVFYDYCINNGVDYYIHAVGMDRDRSIYSWKYLFGNSKIQRTLAQKFELQENLLDRFYLIYNNAHYKVFKVITLSEFNAAKELLNEADLLIANHSFSEAESALREALAIYPNFGQVRLKLAKVLNLQNRNREAVVETKKALSFLKYQKSLH